MAEQRFSVPTAPTKTAATSEHRRERQRAIKHSAMREQLENTAASVGNRAPSHGGEASREAFILCERDGGRISMAHTRVARETQLRLIWGDAPISTYQKGSRASDDQPLQWLGC
jgi:hypothetical protein